MQNSFFVKSKIQPRHIAVAFLSLTCFFSSHLVCAEEKPAINAAQVEPDEDLPFTAENLALVRGRWEGVWQLADGSRGRLRMQIQKADDSKIIGSLQYSDSTYPDNESITVDVVPELREGRCIVKLGPDAPELSWQLRKSGKGYRLSWTSYSVETKQSVSNELSKGLVNKVLPPVTGVEAVTVKDPGSALPANWERSGAFVEIFVRGYKDTNGDGIGDLKGVTASLDYLKDLGVKGIWLMPILESQDHDHGYAVSNYRAIEPAYGSLADFDELLKEAHARGIGVIMDYVMNHSSGLNPIFQNALSGPDNPYRDWYLWEPSKPDGWNIYGKDPWMKTPNGYYFAGFAANMPDWNLTNRAVVDYHLNNLRYWLNRGVDGFRFDAVGNLVENGSEQWESQPQNYVLMREVRALLDQYSQRYMVCEAPADPVGFSKACGSAFSFGNNKNVVRAGKGNVDAIEAAANYPLHAPDNIATMLTNHDSFAGRRVFNQTGGNLKTYRLAAATYLTQPGIPFIYYGEEIGMSGGGKGVGGDAELRTPFSWSGDAKTAGFSTGIPFRELSNNVAEFNVALEADDPDSLLSFYKNLLRLRSETPALAKGSYEFVNAKGTLLSFQRKTEGSRVLLVFNYGTAEASVEVADLPAAISLQGLYPNSAQTLKTNAKGRLSLLLPAQSFVIYRF